MRVPFGEWLPDQPALGNPGMVRLVNAYPRVSSYTAANALSPITTPLATTCLGGFTARDKDDNTYTFAADATHLYQLAGTTWTDVSRAGGYTTTSQERWYFAQFGEQVIATNFTSPPQVIALGAANFADLGGAPPFARYITVIRGFVVLAGTYDATDGNRPQRVRWSGIENPTLWDYDPVNMSDWQDLVGEGGWNMGVVGGEFGLIFQERQIWRMSFVGSPNIFQFDLVEKNRGTPAPGSIAAVGRMVFYLAEDGFYVTDGSGSQPIGVNRVDRTFLADADQSYYWMISSAVDPARKMVYWIYCGAGHSGIPNKMLVYNWAAQRWGNSEQRLEYLFPAFSAGAGANLIDGTTLGPTNMDTGPYAQTPIDSRLFADGRLILAGFNPSHEFGHFYGPALPATLETTEVELNPGFMTLINRVLPMVDGASGSTAITGAVAYRHRQEDLLSGYGNSYAAQPTGWIGLRKHARYHRFQMQVTGGFDNALGFSVEGTRMGIR
jgi:hypothetical protein